MKLSRFRSTNDKIRYALRENCEPPYLLKESFDFFECLDCSLNNKLSFRDLMRKQKTEERVDLMEIIQLGRMLSPVPFRNGPGTGLVTGTGLTHIQSAEIRNDMNSTSDGHVSDSMKMYLAGQDGGRPLAGKIGVQPEWFFKGTGRCLVPSGNEIEAPNFSLSTGEEAEVAGVYYIGHSLQPVRLGYVLTNDISDHKLEGKNYLYLAPSKIRSCGIGPELFMGELPLDLAGKTVIRRSGSVIWEKEFKTGERNMTHSIANLEHHHFKHLTLLNPGDIHIHLLGCPVFSFGSEISLNEGDEIEIDIAQLGTPLVNKIRASRQIGQPILIGSVD